MKSIAVFISLFIINIVALQAQTINVSTAIQLQSALNTATAGQTIVLADGIYSKSGGFIIPANINGTSSNPITLKGSALAILTSNNLNSGYGLGLRGNTYWILDGFTIYMSAKGIVLDSSHHNTIKNIHVNRIGDEGIHLRSYSSYNTIDNCFIDSTGQTSPGFGEAIYIGSAVSNWPTYSKGNADTCNYNEVTNNSFGNHVSSENIDIKEGTTGGRIAFNTFNGTGLNNQNSADSWIDVKGNYYTIECNTGSNTIADGFQTHILVAGWGDYNTFSNNMLSVNSSGYGILITTTSSKGTATHNIVCSTNIITGTNNGLTNGATGICLIRNCTTTTSIKKSSLDKTSIQLYPNPSTDILQIKISDNYLHTPYLIVDVLGRVQASGTLDHTVTSLPTTAFVPGMYFFILSNNPPVSISFLKQ
ncbi:T9SS type A sorting domain-containing protein [Cytophaga aurantiaca]|uniref:T9SS type A sorting domain-containing protein n=1 Tax=Cytophaga aurantiaca TaxID=29530 RepID=UPI000371FE64|nr:right-handed parallel beta-helix repeat-containing protein [Cytophaga aurantiaca]